MTRDLILNYGKKTLRQFEKLMEKTSLVGNSTFFEPHQFSWIANLENNWQLIRQELDQLLVEPEKIPNFQDISPDQYNLTKDNKWKTFFLYAYGYKLNDNCLKCPETTRLLEQVPNMKTAFFSIMFPHKHIPEHRGPYKGVLRYHLALKVPQPETSCRLRVGEDIRYWQEGKSLVFDDSYAHEAWNDSEEIRVVLFMDFVRPLAFPVAIINQFIIKLIGWSPFVQDGLARQNKNN